ncbi:MAG TPA: hypothetical protein DCP63_02850 [Bacteroidetes bacterium]|nr:hypothetical protein [Bacteroidota bacterium]
MGRIRLEACQLGRLERNTGSGWNGGAHHFESFTKSEHGPLMKKKLRRKVVKPHSHPQPELHPQTFYYECKSDPIEIRSVEPFLMKVNNVAKLDDGTFYRLLVAATEAVNNGIVHGNRKNPAKRVLVTCILRKEALILRVKDQGKGFRLEDIPDPLDEKNLLKTSGRGVFLMRSMMDGIKYVITDEGTEVELTINLKLLG